MGLGVGGGLPSAAYRYEVVAHCRDRRMTFTVESHVEADLTRAGRKRMFRSKESADARAAALNHQQHQGQANER